MLRLKNIAKTYDMGEIKIDALKDVSLNFRKNEFVSILGPSGCGKTTLLNIIGGLDKYTSGDLIIDGKSTKSFKNKNWDAYRNSSIGFVFQNYNLIPHLSILENVELSLTLTGVKAKERKKRASKALADVGLGEILNKKPNQLSGGQMQRVAIARALVNNPRIILADEPTGALDSETSVQLMEILKEISKNKLIIMVTHNKELAEIYSSRIINLLDGKIVGDTKPYSPKSVKEREILSKTSMSLFTAFKLSFKNLVSKKAKTIITSLAGSIGIIGVALVLAVSSGFTNYINDMQTDTLSSYPIAISTVAIDYDSVAKVLSNSGNQDEEKSEESLSVYDLQQVIGQLGHLNYLSSNFVSYIQDYFNADQESAEPTLSSIRIQYATNLHIYTQNGATIQAVDTTQTTNSIYGTTSSSFFEGFSDKDFVLSYYDVLEGEYPKNSSEVALVISENNTISKQQLEKLGIPYNMESAGVFTPIDIESLIGKEYKVISNDDYYLPVYDGDNLTDFEYNTNIEQMFNSSNTQTFKISGILRIKEEATSTLFEEGIMYLPEFTTNYIQSCRNSLIAQKTIENKILYEQFVLDISEVKAFTGGTNPFIFDNPYYMQTLINEQYKTDMSLDEVVNLALQAVGASTLPSAVYIYPNSFDAKQNIITLLNDWNKSDAGKGQTIVYTDATEFLTGTLGQLIDIISYVLIAFASISLIVSSIMIGIITYTSVIERTKEIGVLRSLGARKKDISRLFNAETTSIGIFSGLLGIGITYALCPLINLIINSVSGTNVGRIALLNPLHALILVAISMLLTLISGLIPSRIAAKKDPVIALRTE